MTDRLKLLPANVARVGSGVTTMPSLKRAFASSRCKDVLRVLFVHGLRYRLCPTMNISWR